MVAAQQQVIYKTPMTSGNNNLIDVRKAIAEDLYSIKGLADRYRKEIGFVLRPALVKSINDQEIFVAFMDGILSGFIHYHHRRDSQTTLYHIAVAPEKLSIGIGRKLINKLRSEAESKGKSSINLKCPVDLMANKFYERCGFILTTVAPGKHRSLNVWQLNLK